MHSRIIAFEYISQLILELTGSQNLMIVDLLTSPQGHQFDLRMEILLEFCSALHPRRFTMFECFDPLGTPSASNSHPWGMTQATE